MGRTFIEPRDSIRHFGVRIKLNAVREVIEGKRAVVVDDSIVRGTTVKKNMHMIRSAGAREIHVRISSPPIISPCFYGIDTPTKEELIAANLSIEEIREFLQVNSLGYLSLEGLKKCVAGHEDKFCYACFTGDYPVSPPAERMQLEFFIKEV